MVFILQGGAGFFVPPHHHPSAIPAEGKEGQVVCREAKGMGRKGNCWGRCRASESRCPQGAPASPLPTPRPLAHLVFPRTPAGLVCSFPRGARVGDLAGEQKPFAVSGRPERRSEGSAGRWGLLPPQPPPDSCSPGQLRAAAVIQAPRLLCTGSGLGHSV